MIQRNPERTLTLHRLLQIVLQESMDQETQAMWAQRAVKVISQLFPIVEKEDNARILCLLPQVHHAIALLKQWKMTLPEARNLHVQSAQLLDGEAEHCEPARS